MTLAELKQRFPLRCHVRLTEAAKSKGMARAFGGDVGTVQGHKQQTDLADNPFFTLVVSIEGYRKPQAYPATAWERASPVHHGERNCTSTGSIRNRPNLSLRGRENRRLH